MGESIIRLIKPADIITLVNALLGLASIITLAGGDMEGALILVLVAVIADAADGAIARYSGFGTLGANLDSLADTISFGVAPAAATFIFLGDQWYLAGPIAGFYLVCGILRLARFNVAGKKDVFMGLPITAGGFILALFLLVKDLVEGFVHVFIPFVVVISLLMISTVNYPKLKSPVLLAPMGILLILDIILYYSGYQEIVKLVSLILLVLISGYILTPVGRKIYGRNK